MRDEPSMTAGTKVTTDEVAGELDALATEAYAAGKLRNASFLSACAAHVRDLAVERDALAREHRRLSDAALARFAAGCAICGAMHWSVTASGGYACGSCGNVFDKPITPEVPRG